MTGNSAIVDSNVFIDLMKGSKDIANRLEALDDVYISPIVLAELRFGALCSGNPARHLALVKQAIDKCKPLLIDAITAEIFVETKLDLKTKGKPIPENDIWIAASAIQHKLKVFTNDQHFYQVEKLTFI